MDYVDTDVLIHSFVEQDPSQNLRANDLIEELINKNTFIISWLSVQEVGFVLGKLAQPVEMISINLKSLMAAAPVRYESVEFLRAMELADKIGFRDFNDCLHTAIAEQHCTDLYTCNYKDFKRIQPFTSLNIHYL